MARELGTRLGQATVVAYLRIGLNVTNCAIVQLSVQVSNTTNLHRARSRRGLRGKSRLGCGACLRATDRWAAVVSFVFGEFELDPARAELRRAGEVVPVQPKVLRLLVHLAQHRDRVVSNDELLSALWPGEVVASGSIKRAIKSARQVLGEHGDGASSIRTARGHGYQFVAELRETQGVAAQPASKLRSPEQAPTSVVERAALVRVLEDSWLEAELGQGQAVLLSGEAGVGKSWALQRLAAHALRRGGVVWFGRAADVEGAPAYWPFITMLRDALQASEGLPWLELMGDGAMDLAQALPELRVQLRVTGEAPSIEATAARFRFFDSLLRLLRRAAERAPLLIMVDDLPLADAPTRQLFGFLARHAAGSRILLAATARRGAGGQNVEALGQDLRAVECYARTVQIAGFSAEEVARFVEAHTCTSAEPALVGRLTEQTGGNPLLLTHIIHVCRAASPDALPRWEVLENLAQSHGVQSAIERHVGALRPSARACLHAAALLGQCFSPGLLAEVLDSTPERIDGWLSEAAALGLLASALDAASRACFAHGLVQEALAQGLEPARRRELHKRAAEALADRHAHARAEASEVAHHFLKAGCYERALHYSLVAARLAIQQLAAGAALLHYAHALEALDGMAPNLPLRAAILLEKANAHAQHGAFAEARANFVQTANLARTLGEPATLARAALGIASPLEGALDEELLDLLREALSALDEQDDLYPLVASALAKALCHSRDMHERSRAIATALSAARGLRDPRMRAQALGLCHEAMSEPEHAAERELLSRELATIARSCSDVTLLLHAARAQLQDAVELGDMQTVEVSLTLLEQLAERAREPFCRWHAKLYRSMCAMVAGRLELAVELSEEALRLGTIVGGGSARLAYIAQVSGIQRLMGEAERARSLVYEAAARYPSVAGWRCAMGVSEVEVGRVDAAREIFVALMAEGIAALKRDAFALSVLCPLADLCNWVGDGASAGQLYKALQPYAALCGTVGFGVATYGPITRYLGALAAQQGRFELAREHFETSERASARMKSPTFTCLNAIIHARAMADPACPPRLRQRGYEQLQFARKLARARGFRGIETFGELLEPHARALSFSETSKGTA